MQFRRVVGLTLFCLWALEAPAPAYDPKYLEEIVGSKAVSFSDGTGLIMVLLQLEDEHPDFASQMKFLEENRLLKKQWSQKSADAPLRRGELAYMLVRMLKLKGGLKARILGLNQRFAMEELIYQGIMREGHPADLVTGRELVLIMTRTAQQMISREGPK